MGSVWRPLGVYGGCCWDSAYHLLKNLEFYMYGFFPARVSAYLVHAVPAEAERGCHILRGWSYRCLWIALWVLGIQPGSSGGAASAQGYRVISPASPYDFSAVTSPPRPRLSQIKCRQSGLNVCYLPVICS